MRFAWMLAAVALSACGSDDVRRACMECGDPVWIVEGSGGAAGGGGEGCTDTNPCGERERCREGRCEPVQCFSKADCPDGFTCDVDAGSCRRLATCDWYACWADGGTCELNGDDRVCVDGDCGTPANSCAACALGPSEGRRTPGAPVLAAARQIGDCVPGVSSDCPGALRCSFRVEAALPEFRAADS